MSDLELTVEEERLLQGLTTDQFIVATAKAFERLYMQREHLAKQVRELSKALARRERDFQALAEAAAISPEEPTTCFFCIHFGQRGCAWEPKPGDSPCDDFFEKED